jgi:hypothetical protein
MKIMLSLRSRGSSSSFSGSLYRSASVIDSLSTIIEAGVSADSEELCESMVEAEQRLDREDVSSSSSSVSSVG